MNAMTQFDEKAHAVSFAVPSFPEVTERDFFLPLAIIGGLALLILTFGTHVAVQAFDRSSAVRERILAQNGITQRIDEVAQMVVPQTVWDDAVAHLDNRFDESWAEANIGKYLSQTDGITRSFVIDRNNQLLFASQGGLQNSGSEFPAIARQATPLLRDVRRKEQDRGSLRALPSGAMISHAIQASAPTLIDGKLSILTATLVQPDFGKFLPAASRAPIVVTAMPIDQDFLDTFARRYMLSELHIRKIDDQRRAGDVEIPALDPRGTALAYFAWRPLNPGYSMLREFLPPIGLVLLLLATVAFVQLRKIHLAARVLMEQRDSFNAMRG